MSRSQILTIAATVLILIGIAMVGITTATILSPNRPPILPPGLTGIGFFAIAWVFFKLRNPPS